MRVREIMRACILASSQEYQLKRHGEILNIILRVGGAIKHMAGDKAAQFSNIHTYLVDLEVLRDEAARAVSHMEEDKEGLRIDLNMRVLEVVNLETFLDLAVVVNNTEIPPPGVQLTRLWYTANQDYYYRMPGNTSQDGDHSHLLNEEQLQRLCGHMYDFAKQIGYGLRTYNREVAPSSSIDSSVINIHQLAMMLKRMPTSRDHPLGFALNFPSSFAICPHVIHSYTSWREYETERPYYRWTEEVVPGTDTNTLTYLEFHMDAVCELYSQNGLQLPAAFRQQAWNQLGVESGYVADCVRKRDALQCWEEEFATMDAPPPLFDGDNRFPPKLQAHPKWYMISAELRRLGRATSSRKVFDRLPKQWLARNLSAYLQPAASSPAESPSGSPFPSRHVSITSTSPPQATSPATLQAAPQRGMPV